MPILRLPSRDCEVCGGRVRPIDDQSVFGYCEKCGLVYALRDRLKEALGAETVAGLEAGTAGESTEARDTRIPVSESTPPARSSGSHWRCPDCEMDIHSDNDSDLGFAKREHIREYHPNRSTG